MSLRSFFLTALGASICLSLSSCLILEDKSNGADAAWAKPVPITDLRQFDGVYTNASVEPAHHPKDDELRRPLFPFLVYNEKLTASWGYFQTGRTELRASADGQTLSLRFFVPGRGTLESATLHRGHNFDLTPSGLVLRAWTVKSMDTTFGLEGGFGAYSNKTELLPTATGDLLGKTSGINASSKFLIYNEAEVDHKTYYWRKIAP